MIKIIIYKATNIKNGKIYIGLTTKTLEERIKHHKRDSLRMDTYFYRAIKKHGFDSFKWEVIDNSAKSIQELEDLEKYYIKKYNLLKLILLILRINKRDVIISFILYIILFFYSCVHF